LGACRDLGLFKKKVCGLWVPCRADDPDSVPDVTRLARAYQWDRKARRFVRKAKVRP
jgi:hypothetical protein